jgi:hypothetical protein
MKQATVFKMLPISASLSQSERTDQTANATSSASQRGSGYRGSVFNNVALGGSSLDARASDSSSGSLPMWVWIVLGGLAVAGGLWYVLKGKKS